jgi:dTDP-D-glucose 4,6-dehydratase
MNVLVTGGCGFIGSNLVKHLRRERSGWTVVNLDQLTYAGNLESLRELEKDPHHIFVRGDIGNRRTASKRCCTWPRRATSIVPSSVPSSSSRPTCWAPSASWKRVARWGSAVS